jgi:hypothetical protein
VTKYNAVIHRFFNGFLLRHDEGEPWLWHTKLRVTQWETDLKRDAETMKTKCDSKTWPTKSTTIVICLFKGCC